jgi:predicted nucleotidyltransferase
MRSNLERYARILAKWAENLPLKKIYLFGSQVRGDATSTSDLDVAIVFDPPATVDERMWNWQHENDTDFIVLREELGIPLSLHVDPTDSAWPHILAAAENPVLSVGKVSCVITPVRASKQK